MINDTQDPFDTLLSQYQRYSAVSIYGKAKANIALVQELRARADIPKDSEDMAYLDSIQQRAMELLNGSNADTHPLDKLENSENLIVTPDIREKYETMCMDLGNLVIKLRPYMAESLGAFV
jgi:hypothetical protein